jgi:hypothetical protein
VTVSTSVDAGNEHMIRVNERIGYSTGRETIEFDGNIDTVSEHLITAVTRSD